MTLRAGIVGLGEIGQYHLPALRETPGAALVAVCDLDAGLAQAAAGPDAAVFTDLNAMLAEARLDVLDVCLPHHLHLPAGLAALEAGCHVLLEKPLAMSVAECDRLLAAARVRGRAVAVSHNQLFYEPHRRLRELVRSGALGELRTIRARLGVGGKYGAWRAQPERAGGGLLIDAGAHRVYMTRALGGPVRSVTAVMDAPGAEDTLSVVLEFESGALGTIDASYHGPEGAFDDRLEVFGDRGIAEVTGCEAFFERFAPADGPRLRVWSGGAWTEDPVRGSWDASVRESVGAALAALAAGEAPPVDGAAGRETVALIEAAYRSAREGRRVPIGDEASD